MTNLVESLLGKSVWIEMDEDKSGTTFSPRKGAIVHVFEHPLEKEAIAVELAPAHLALFPFPHRITYIVLQYFSHDQQSILETFRSGLSYAEVLELRNKKALNRPVLTKKDVSRLGAAIVFSWPKLEKDELDRRLEQWRQRSQS